MPVDVTSALRQALRQLEGDRARLEREIQAIRSALNGLGGSRVRGARRRGRPARRGRMSPEARRAASQRMKEYWAKKRGPAAAARPARKEQGK